MYYLLTVCVSVCVCINVCNRVEHRRDGRGTHGSEGQCRATHANVGAVQRFEPLPFYIHLPALLFIYQSIRLCASFTVITLLLYIPAL